MFTLESADNFILKEVEKIVRERWRIMERTTRYGWLIACYQGSAISREQATILSSLATKIGLENCRKASVEIQKACRDLHPHYVPNMAIAIMDEMYTVVILRIAPLTFDSEKPCFALLRGLLSFSGNVVENQNGTTSF